MNNKGDNRLGIYLRALRTSLGYSQQRVAEELNVLRQTYSHYERGRIIPPTQTIVALARIFDVPIEDLMALVAVNDDDPAAGSKRSTDSSAFDMDDYVAYLKEPINISRLRFMSESEKRLLYYFNMLTKEDKQDFTQFMRIRAKRNKES